MDVYVFLVNPGKVYRIYSFSKMCFPKLNGVLVGTPIVRCFCRLIRAVFHLIQPGWCLFCLVQVRIHLAKQLSYGELAPRFSEQSENSLSLGTFLYFYLPSLGAPNPVAVKKAYFCDWGYLWMHPTKWEVKNCWNLRALAVTIASWEEEELKFCQRQVFWEGNQWHEFEATIWGALSDLIASNMFCGFCLLGFDLYTYIYICMFCHGTS